MNNWKTRFKLVLTSACSFLFSLIAIFLMTTLCSVMTNGSPGYSPDIPSLTPKFRTHIEDTENTSYRFPTEVNGEEIHPGGSVLPGYYMAYHPYITHEGDDKSPDIYSFITISCRGFNADEVVVDDFSANADSIADADFEAEDAAVDGKNADESIVAGNDHVIPAYIIPVNPGWKLISQKTDHRSVHRTYMYSKRISPGSATPPLCDYMQFADFSLKSFADMTDDDLGIDCDAAIVSATRLGLTSQTDIGIDEAISIWKQQYGKSLKP